ncbi:MULTISPECIES: linear amide C-N hydrolase [Kitasatospora]|nr:MULTISPECIES: linear amide C-N hydrolase [Kitasatospora]
MCTRVLWRVDGGPVLVGRNMDWKQSFHTNLWALARGIDRVGGPGGAPNPLRWQARYGSLVAGAYDAATTDGVNEAGLAAHVLWLSESEFGARDAALPGLAASMWAQYALDTCGSVAEAVEAVGRYQVIGQQDPYAHVRSTVHLVLDDAGGDSAVIEVLDGKPVVHHGPQYAVVTNSPPYDQQLSGLKQYAGFGGTLPLPGTTLPADRFVRASYYLERLPAPADRAEAYASLLSVMRNAAQPAGTPDPERPNISMTRWRTLADLSNGVYAFESSFRPDIVWTTLADLDFTRTATLDLTQPDLVGDVTARYRATEPFTFLTD